MTSSVTLFTDQQRVLLTAALNQIVPPQEKMPGAGDLGVADFIESFIAPRLPLRRRFLEGLAQIEITAARRPGQPFAELSPAAQLATLKVVEQAHPAFFEELVRQTYNGYYTHPRIHELLGYAPGAPDQALPFDEKLLEPQRQRGAIWRPA